jgi:CubicO group peptidase (beta-lactamase class C family)
MSMDRRSVLGLAVASTGFASTTLASTTLAATTLGAAAEAGAAPPVSIETSGDPSGRYTQALADIARYGALHRQANALPGLTLAVTDRDGFTSLMRFGYANMERREPVRDDHLFQIGSISKSFAALCAWRLVEAGRLNLDDNVQDLLPEVPLPDGAPITVQSLLSHASGLPDDAPAFPRGGDQRLWRGYETGAHWSYSNLGYGLLGEIVSRRHGRPYADVVKREVLEPLGMKETVPAILTRDRARYPSGYSPFFDDRAYPQGGKLAPGPWVNMIEASGCIASTARDMAVYGRYLMAAGSGRGSPLLSDAAAARFCTPVIDAPDWPGVNAKYANGLAVVDVGGRPLLTHTGGMLTFNSSIHVDPTSGVAAFASTNAGDIPYRPRALTAYACERLRAARDRTPPAKPAPVQPPADSGDDRRGRYLARAGKALEIRIQGFGGLTALVGGRTIGLESVGDDVLIAKDPAATPHPFVFRRKNGRVERVWWGDAEFVRDDVRFTVAFTEPTSPAVAALTGRYECDDPWRGGFTVLAQGEMLYVDGAMPLTPLPDGSYRVGDKDWSPDRLRFDAAEGGRPQRAILSGVDYMRREI